MNYRVNFLLLLLFLFPSLLFSQEFQNQHSNLVIRLKQDVPVQQFIDKNNLATARSGQPTWTVERCVSRLLNIYRLSISGNPDKTQQWINQVARLPEVIEVGQDIPLQYRNTQPNDELFSSQWNLEKIQLPDVWAETTGGQNARDIPIVIAILEKGIDMEHPDLKENIWVNEGEIPDNNIDDDGNGYVDDYFGLNLDDLTDEHPVRGHGTQVSGIIGAKGNNEQGIAGINWNAKILFLSGVDLTSEVIEAYEYLYNLRKRFNETNGREGAFVVVTNNSFGWDNTRPEQLRLGVELCEMFDLLGSQGILSAGAGPNNDINVEIAGDTPTNCTSDFFIGVTSTDEADEKSEDGGFGEFSIDIGAPGESIQATDKGNKYGSFSGTSFATPMVAGAIGLLYSIPCTRLADDAIANPAGTARFIKELLLRGTDPVNGLKGRSVSGGRLNIYNTMLYLQNYCGIEQSRRLAIENLYPNPLNPAINLLSVEYQNRDFGLHNIFISNTLGQIVYQETFQPSRFVQPLWQKDLSFLSEGYYILSIQSRQGSTTSHPFIVRK